MNLVSSIPMFVINSYQLVNQIINLSKQASVTTLVITGQKEKRICVLNNDFRDK